MEEAGILSELRERFRDAVLEASSAAGDDVLVVAPESLLALAGALKAEPLNYALLLDLTCVDRAAERGRLEMVYTFLSIGRNHLLRIKTDLPSRDPRVASLTALWRNADWLEREAYDLFGVRFEGHPDLRRLLLYEGFQGHPLRKDYPLRRRQPLIPLRKEP
jgi:NADH-quinone oxidoreductase subunit C